MITVVIGRMAEIPVGWRQRIRELSLGPVAWGSWSWTFQNGDCWVACAFEGVETNPEAMVGWAAVTKEVDLLPVIGAYVDEGHRGRGLATMLATALLRWLVPVHLSPGAEVYATTHRWPGWQEVIESCGLQCRQWA